MGKGTGYIYNLKLWGVNIPFSHSSTHGLTRIYKL